MAKLGNTIGCKASASGKANFGINSGLVITLHNLKKKRKSENVTVLKIGQEYKSSIVIRLLSKNDLRPLYD